MKLKVRIIPYTLQFKRPAGTSRGVYTDHKVWYVIISSPHDSGHWGIGECAPLFDLSCDYNDQYEINLKTFCQTLEETGAIDYEAMRNYPSMLFGLETAMRQYEQNSFSLWQTPFTEGEKGIPINGLIWMGDFDYMYQQIEDKMKAGFRCIKLKIGAINFEDELELLKHIRQHFSSDKITLRVDANGGFSEKDALAKLERLAELDLHSIEQPIKAGQWQQMAYLTANTPLPIALDEELIGINDTETKRKLLETVRPQYIILKPTLHGGIKGSEEWIRLAEELGIGWWITSALESNIGLNAIAQWCSTFDNQLPQGLGTGALYTNNIDMPLEIREDSLWNNPKKSYIIKDIFRE